MTNKEYWEQRLGGSTYNKQSKKAKKELLKLYKEQAELIKKDIVNLYYNMISDDGISTTNLYRYGRFNELLKSIERITGERESKEIALITKILEDTYISTLGKPSNMEGAVVWNLRNDNKALEVINANFKGANFKTRIQRNRRKFIDTLQKEISSAVAGRTTMDRVIATLMSRHGVAFNEAERLARTEIMRVNNQGRINQFKEKGYKLGYYAYINDGKHCELCARLAEETKKNPIPLDELEPIHHPRCRCGVRVLTKLEMKKRGIENV